MSRSLEVHRVKKKNFQFMFAREFIAKKKEYRRRHFLIENCLRFEEGLQNIDVEG